jgi:hypothetical protein
LALSATVFLQGSHYKDIQQEHETIAEAIGQSPPAKERYRHSENQE